MISRKNIDVTFAGALSGDMAGSLNSDAIDVRDLIYGSIQTIFTGAPVGTMKLQCSNSLTYATTGQQPITPVWTDIQDSSISVAAAGNILYNITNLSYDLIRVVYTRTSGTGTLIGRMVGKG